MSQGTLRIIAAVIAFAVVGAAGIIYLDFAGAGAVTSWAYVTLAALGFAFLVYAAIEYAQTRRLDSITSQFDTRTIVLMPIAIALNIIMGQTVAAAIKLPIYLDSIGTILVGVLAGPLAGALMIAAMMPVSTPATTTYAAVKSRRTNSRKASPATVPTTIIRAITPRTTKSGSPSGANEIELPIACHPRKANQPSATMMATAATAPTARRVVSAVGRGRNHPSLEYVPASRPMTAATIANAPA